MVGVVGVDFEIMDGVWDVVWYVRVVGIRLLLKL